jgi:acetyltransferase AlgX (SGNH hydrolase-like protein)
MNISRSPRTTIRRAIELVGLAGVLSAFFVAGTWVDPWNRRPQVSAPVSWETPPYDDSKGFPRPDARRPADPRQPEPRAMEARTAVIHRDAAAILAECQRSAGGDWGKWQRDTALYRRDLKAKLEALKEMPEPKDGPGYQALEGRAGFPLFEIDPRKHLKHLYDPAKLDEFRRQRPVVAAHRWLRNRGIDLLFVAIPEMPEVYIEHFLDPCPPDGIVAPDIRQTLLELLKEDVEVVDGFTLFRALRDNDSEYLYNTADPHWAPRGMRIMAKEIADRIERYKFGARARFALPIVRTMLGKHVLYAPYVGPPDRYAWDLLSAEQQKRAEEVQTTTQVDVVMKDNRIPPDDPTSPVLLIGHSYVPKFREQLIKELNLLVSTRIHIDGTTQMFNDLLREPELLDHCRVVVWITTEDHMTRFMPMPGPILKTLDSAK